MDNTSTAQELPVSGGTYHRQKDGRLVLQAEDGPDTDRPADATTAPAAAPKKEK